MDEHRILVVDDELFVRELLDEYFSKIGFRVDVACDGPSAMKKVADYKYELALVDLKMADMDGIEVIHRIRELDPDLILILMTGYPTVESSVEAMRAGAYDYVIKPFRLNELKTIINRGIKEYSVRCELSAIKSRIHALEAKLGSIAGPDSENPGTGRSNRKSKSSRQDHSIDVGDVSSQVQLERWGKLLKDGLITQKEFEQNKQRILSAIS